MVRAPVFVPAVESARLDPDVLYIRIRSFDADTPSLVADILARESGSSGALVLDLRTNSGGPVEPAVQTADLLLPSGAAIGSLEGVVPARSEVYISETEPVAMFRAVTILVNHDTAGGAELLSLALRAAGIASIAGERTLGFGRVETRWKPPDRPPVAEGVLRGPHGEAFHGIGVEPDIATPMSAALVYPPETDPLLNWLIDR